MPNGWYLEPGQKDPTMKIIAGVVAVGAIALGVVFMTRGDDEGGGGTARPPATTVVGATTTTVAGSTTTTAASTTTTGPATTTPNGSLDGAALLAAMPTGADSPSGWIRYAEPVASPAPGEGASYCGQEDEVTRAQRTAIAQAMGPQYDLPDGTWFGFDVFAFTSVDGAEQFMLDAQRDANLCSSAPLSYPFDDTMRLLGEQYSLLEWEALEGSAASAGQFAGSEGVLRITTEVRYTAVFEGRTVSVRATILVLYEQHGRTVLEYWLGGTWDYQGVEVALPAAVHQPVQAELDAAVDAVREPMLTRLTELGAV